MLVKCMLKDQSVFCSCVLTKKDTQLAQFIILHDCLGERACFGSHICALGARPFPMAFSMSQKRLLLVYLPLLITHLGTWACQHLMGDTAQTHESLHAAVQLLRNAGMFAYFHQTISPIHIKTNGKTSQYHARVILKAKVNVLAPRHCGQQRPAEQCRA